MADFDAESFAEQAVLIGLIDRIQLYEARNDAEDGSLDSLARSMMRKGMITSWQRDKLLKGDGSGFFFGGTQALFHIAEGTFARVYRGVRLSDHLPVAIKVLRKRFGTDTNAVQRFNKEAEAGLKLIHPNIVQIHEVGEQDKHHFMIMEYVEGSNLRDFLKIRNHLDAPDALPLMIGLAKGLQYSLDQGVTHRDIKATNVLISHRGQAKLVDFGLATVGAESKMEVAHGQRTVDYSALERTCGSPKGDFRSDIYFLGCVFYQMLTGSPPMPETEASDHLTKMLKRSFHAIKPLKEHRRAPAPAISEIIEGMMTVDVVKRYQIMKDVVDDLENFQKTLEQPTANESVTVKATPSGDLGDSQRVTDEDVEFFEDVFSPKMSSAKHVLCVEVQDTIQEAFRKTLSKMGYRVLLVGDAERAAERYRESPPDAVVYDIDGLGPEALDAFLDMHEKAHEDGHDLAALVLLGPRQGELSGRLPSDDRLVVLSKPIKMKDVQDAITQLVPINN